MTVESSLPSTHMCLLSLASDWQGSKTGRQAWQVTSRHYSALSSSFEHDDSSVDSSPEDVFVFDDRESPPRDCPRSRMTGTGRVTDICRETSLPRPRLQQQLMQCLFKQQPILVLHDHNILLVYIILNYTVTLASVF